MPSATTTSNSPAMPSSQASWPEATGRPSAYTTAPRRSMGVPVRRAWCTARCSSLEPRIAATAAQYSASEGNRTSSSLSAPACGGRSSVATITSVSSKRV